MNLKIIQSILIFLFFSTSMFSQDIKGSNSVSIPIKPKAGSIHALIIGISDYQNFRDLDYGDKDAIAFRNLLLSNAFNADSSNIVLLLNEKATVPNIEEALANMVSFVKEGDKVFIHFSGHGGIEKLNTITRGCFLTWESSSANLRLSSYRIDDLNVYVGELATANKANVYLIMDACHAGEVNEDRYAKNSNVNEYLLKIIHGKTFLSCGPSEVSYEGDQWGKGRGLFSYHLVNGLSGMADLDKDGLVDMNEIGFYVKDKVKKEARPNEQNPIITGEDEIVSTVIKNLKDKFSVSPNEMAMVAMKDVSSKGYEEQFLDSLNAIQKEKYYKIKTSLNNDDLLVFDSALTDFQELKESKIPLGLEKILERKFIAQLQSQPQKLLDKVLKNEAVPFSQKEIGQMAINLNKSCELMTSDHYLYNTTKAKYHFFQYLYYYYDENYIFSNELKSKSKKEIESAIDYEQDFDFLYLALGNIYFSQNNLDKSANQFKYAAQLNPENYLPYYNLGLLSMKTDSLSQAAEYFSKAIMLNPNDAFSYYQKANTLRQLGKFEEALNLYDNAIQLSNWNFAFYNNKEITIQEINKLNPENVTFDGAQEYFKNIKQENLCVLINNDYDKYFYNKYLVDSNINILVDIEVCWSKSQTAKDKISKFMIEEEDYLGKGIIYLIINSRSIDTYEEKQNWFNLLPLMNENQLDRLYKILIKEKIKLFEIELKYNQKEKFLKIKELFIEKKEQEALIEFNKLIKTEQRPSYLHYELGKYYLEDKQYDNAIKSFETALGLDPKNTDALFVLAYTNSEIKNYTKAIDAYNKLLTLKPENWSAWNNIANAYAAAKDYQKANEIYIDLLDQNPDSRKTYYYNLACLSALQNKKSEAIQYLEKSLINGYDRYEHLTTDTDLDGLREMPEYKVIIKKHFPEK